MLDEYRQSCKETADYVPGWMNISKNDLCRLCVETENKDSALYNAYFSALLYKYWNLISKYHGLCDGLATPEMCYDWLVIAITYAIEHKRWEDPDSAIYNDPNGPDKVINRSMKCGRLNLYQFSNRKKRKDGFGTLSLDELKENLNNGTFDIEDTDNSLEQDVSVDVKDYVRSAFNRKDYFLAYMIDHIITEPVFDIKIENDKTTTVFNIKKLAKYLRQIDENYCKRFAKEYYFKEEDVLFTLKYFGKNGFKNIYTKIEDNFNKLKHDSYLLSRWEIK